MPGPIHLGGMDFLLELSQEAPLPATRLESRRSPLTGQTEATLRARQPREPCLLPRAATNNRENQDILPHQDILYALHLLLRFLHLKALKFQIKRYNESSSRINSHSDLS